MKGLKLRCTLTLLYTVFRNVGLRCWRRHVRNFKVRNDVALNQDVLINTKEVGMCRIYKNTANTANVNTFSGGNCQNRSRLPSELTFSLSVMRRPLSEEAYSTRKQTGSFSYIAYITSANHMLYSGPGVIKRFSCSTQLSMKCVLLINLKLLIIANSILPNIAEHENFSANK